MNSFQMAKTQKTQFTKLKDKLKQTKDQKWILEIQAEVQAKQKQISNLEIKRKRERLEMAEQCTNIETELDEKINAKAKLMNLGL